MGGRGAWLYSMNEAPCSVRNPSGGPPPEGRIFENVTGGFDCTNRRFPVRVERPQRKRGALYRRKSLRFAAENAPVQKREDPPVRARTFRLLAESADLGTVRGPLGALLHDQREGFRPNGDRYFSAKQRVRSRPNQVSQVEAESPGSPAPRAWRGRRANSES